MRICVLLALLLSFCSAQYLLAQEFITNFFTDDDIGGNGWTLSGADLPSHHLYSSCGVDRIVGGYGVFTGHATDPSFITKAWNNLPPHFEVKIQMALYKIDSWDNEKLFIMVDGTPIQILTWTSSTGTSDLCGDPNAYVNSLNPQWFEHITTYSKTLSHTASTLSFRLGSSLDSWTGSWGFKDLKITLNRCSGSCLTCSDALTCDSCATGLTLVGVDCVCGVGLLRQVSQPCSVTNCVQCVGACGAGYFAMTAVVCDGCNAACGTCTGPSSLAPDCTSCGVGYIDDGTGLCVTCFGSCASCTGAAFNECISCDLGFFLTSNECKSSCPDGTYHLESTSQCISCISPCETCDGSTSNHCFSCLSGFYLYQTTCYTICPFSLFGYQEQCLGSCPLATYPDTNLICQPCPTPFCQTCDNLGVCGTCFSGSFYNSDKLCYATCPVGTYEDLSDYMCIACDLSCLTCNGPTRTDCLSCPPASYIVYGACYTVCPSHTYSATCQLCHDRCLNCTGPSDNECTSCYQFDLLHINESRCLEECYEGDVADNVGMTCMTCGEGAVGVYGKCERCAETCLTCFAAHYLKCLSCEGGQIQFGSTCLTKSGSKIIYMGSDEESDLTIKIVIFMIISALILGIVLECLFLYKTNLLMLVEMMQFLSFFYYLSTPFSHSSQALLLLLYHSHPTFIVQHYNILPTPHFPNTHHPILLKAQLMGKSEVYFASSLYTHVILLFCLIVLLISRVMRGRLYAKINPYIISYTFRLLFMDMCFAIFLFLSAVHLSTAYMKWSLVLLLVDIVVIALSFFWKIRSSVEQNHAHYALFYFNELGTPMATTYNQIQSQSHAHDTSIFPSLFYYFSKLPLVIIILFFSEQPFTQSICLLIFTLFLFLINFRISYRRKMYRFLSYYYHGAIIVAALIVVLLNSGVECSELFNAWILVAIGGMLLMTVLQLVSNHSFFTSVYFWTKAKVRGLH